MKKLLFVILISIHYSSNSQTYSSIINDEEISNFLNCVTIHDKKYSEENNSERKKISNKILKWHSENFINNDEDPYENEIFLYHEKNDLDLIFNKDDQEFIYKQFVSIKDSIWHTRFSKSKLLSKKNKTNNYYAYSVPLFSIDKKKVIFYRVFHCGNECAYGEYYIYSKINKNDWILIKSVNSWQS